MPNQTQPILCCVGADVAGEPTQFLMERAVAASHLDWHVITVEVPAEQLAKAWDGIDVMRFQAARFFAPHQSSIMTLIGAPTPEQLFVGGVTSAMRTADKWMMWHNSGDALLQLLSSKVEWSTAVCWVRGDTTRNRSFLIACQSKKPARIYWTDLAKAEKATEPDSAEQSAVRVPEPLTGLPIVISPESDVAASSQSIASAIEELSATAVVCVGEFEMAELEQLLTMQPEKECALVVITGAPGCRRKLNDSWRAGPVVVITPADLVVAEEAFDQTRWTGQPVNVELLREAYDEYADF